MSESFKSVAFVLVALLAACTAGVVANWSSILRAWSGVEEGPAGMVGQHLVEEFDPLRAASLEIFEFDEDTATVRPFLVTQTEVKEGKRLWCIPSHDNYPADAQQHLAEAATSLTGLEVLGVAGDSPGDHELFGVVAPDPNLLKVGATGVGTLVTMKDLSGKTLVSLIIGNQVPDQPGLHYVRRKGEDAVYVVSLQADKLSTRFEDWIEEDLLKLNPWDIKRVWIHDYSVDELRGALMQRGEMVLEYDDTADPRWRMVKDERFDLDTGEWVSVEMGEDQQLDATRLDDLKYALDDLKIVDVRRKPEGLSADLRATGDFAKNREAVESLAARGFYVASVEGRVELFSNEGEIRVLMRDGVEYVLRFGEIAGGTSGAKKEEQPAGGEGQEEPAEAGGLNRYLFVIAQFNPEGIPEPEIKELPPEEPAAEDGGDQPAGEAGTDSGAPGGPDVPPQSGTEGDAQQSGAEGSGQQPGAEGSGEQPGTEGSGQQPGAEGSGEPGSTGTTSGTAAPPAEESPVDATGSGQPDEGTTGADEPSQPEASGSAAGAEGASEPGPAAGAEGVTEPGAPAGAEGTSEPGAPAGSEGTVEPGAAAGAEGTSEPDASQPGDSQVPPEFGAEADPAAERERIMQENQRAREEYEQQLEDGRKRVDELNARFADWYYVISDEVYRKIHLSREDVVVKKDAAVEGEGEQPGGLEEGTLPGTSGEALDPGQPGAEQPVGQQPASAEQPGGQQPASGQPSAADQPAGTQPGDEPGGGEPGAGEQGPADESGQDDNPVDVFDRLKDAGPEGGQPDD